jgi:hypothetical protein
MATISKSGTPSLATINPGVEHQPGKGLLAGEAIAAGDLCYIKNDGKIWRSNGTSVNAAAKCVGIAAKAADSGQPITVLRGVSFNYGATRRWPTSVRIGSIKQLTPPWWRAAPCCGRSMTPSWR